MKMNKKGKGTASSFLIAMLVLLTMTIGIGITVNDFSGAYNRDSIDYFDNYEDISKEFYNISEDAVAGYDYDQNTTNPDVIRTEDFLFWKAFKVVGKFTNMIGASITLVKQASFDLGIPPTYSFLAIAILSVLIIVLIIKIIRGYSEV